VGQRNGDDRIRVQACAQGVEHRRSCGIGRTHAHTPVLILITTDTVTVISKTGYQLIASHHISPDHNYWPNQQKNPGQRPGNL
jgi:hypothetical protein